MQPICTCHSFEFIPIAEQPEIFVAELGPDDHAKLISACESAAEGFADRRPHGSRTALIGSATLSGLFELRVVWPGAPEPQLRLICMREEFRILVARGFVQDGPRIPSREVELAEQAILKSREDSDELQPKGIHGRRRASPTPPHL
jgi:hypothetical protein